MIDVLDGHRSEVHPQRLRNKDHVPPYLLCKESMRETHIATTSDMVAGGFPMNADMIVHLLNELKQKRQGRI